MSDLIAPHGGTLVNRVVGPDRARELRSEADALPRIDLSAKQSCYLEMIRDGPISP